MTRTWRKAALKLWEAGEKKSPDPLKLSGCSTDIVIEHEDLKKANRLKRRGAKPLAYVPELIRDRVAGLPGRRQHFPVLGFAPTGIVRLRRCCHVFGTSIHFAF